MMGSSDLLLPEGNFYNEVTKKTRIIIGNIHTHDLSFFEGWKLRYGGQYKRTCHFSVDRMGVCYNHFNPDYYSSFLGKYEIDVETISVGLLNLGWIKHDVSKIRWVDWRDCEIDINPNQLFEKKWRDYYYWYPYSEKQITTLVDLLLMLCNKYNIEPLMIDNNTLLTNKKEFWPISFRSNYLYYKTDVSPAFPFDTIIDKIS